MAKRATREALGETLIELAEEHENLVALDADLAKSTTTTKFASAFPDRFFDVGVAEQNMTCVAAGLATTGKVCYTGSFAVFASGRAFDQVRNTIAYANLDVKLCPTHAGVTVGADGGSHQSVEDIALMRAVPNMKVVVPADYYEARAAIRAAFSIPGPVYIRLGREPVTAIFDEFYEFNFGKAVKIREGSDVSILATGIMVGAALSAAEMLAADNISAEVVDVHTLKPLDGSAILESAAKTGAVVTAEEHSIIGGLGSAVAELLSEKQPTRLARIGIGDEFGTSGAASELLEKYGLTAGDIVRAVRKLI
ncbi:MAG: transketolase family protein [Actinobacteria bacterium]|nr:transketolase family protein [Actinomycetota bacterium]